MTEETAGRSRGWRLAGWRPTLLTRIALSLAAVGLVPLALCVYRLIGLTDAAMVDQVLRSHAVAARTAAERVDAFLAVRRSLMAGAAGGDLLAPEELEATGDLLRRSLQAWDQLGVRAVAVFDSREEEVLRAQFADAPDHERVSRGLAAPSAGPVLVLQGGRPLLLRLDLALDGGGSLRVVCDGSELAGVLRSPEMGEQAELVLADRRRQVLAGAAPSLAGFPEGLVRNALSGRVVGVERRFRTADGGWFLGAYAPLTQAPWAVLSRQPSQVAEAVGRRMRRSVQVSFAGALLLIGLSAAGAYRSLIHPLRELAQAQRRLGKAETAGGTRPRDEIADLRSSFSVLEQRFRDREAMDRVFLGRYQVLETIGGGGMGTVFKGWDPKLMRLVALKTVRLGAVVSPEQRKVLHQSLLAEAVTVARLNHPNVVAVYDVEDSAEGAFLAMELVDGCTLDELLGVIGRLHPDSAVTLGLELARGLAAAHGRGIVHRDIKPANVMLGRDGSIKLADFGIAELLSAAEPPRPDRIFGTPGYVPPETLAGRGFGQGGDLWSLGAVLYEALTGKAPFGTSPAGEVVVRTLSKPVEGLRKAVPDVPTELEALILQLLERKPELRPSGAAQVAAELEQIARARSLRWTPPPEIAEASPQKGKTVEGQWLQTQVRAKG